MDIFIDEEGWFLKLIININEIFFYFINIYVLIKDYKIK